MGLTLALLGLVEAATSAGSAANDVRQYFNERLRAEDIIAGLVEEQFKHLVPRIRHLCPEGEPTFARDEFAQRLGVASIQVSAPEQLPAALLPILQKTVTTPGARNAEDSLRPVYEAILQSAVNLMWRRVSTHPALTARVLIDQNKRLLDGQAALAIQSDERASSHDVQVARLDKIQSEQEAFFAEVRQFAGEVSHKLHSALLDKAPPDQHIIDSDNYSNPFNQVRAEDFNHNYGKLARLFQHAPEWDSIQSRFTNVFIEGGRGTGKSMILRRLTAQATIAGTRLSKANATFDDVSQDYFGVYVKLSRGYFSQIEEGAAEEAGAQLLVQHALNLEVFEAFVDALLWLQRESALTMPMAQWQTAATALSSMFRASPPVSSLDDLAAHTVPFEQEQILQYIRDRSFGRSHSYSGSAQECVSFMKRLAALFRAHLFPRKEVRLFLLFDEFETLTATQQRALNTVIKMRLHDLTLKIAVRKEGRRTSETLTKGENIQQPRDYTPIVLDYDVRSPSYAQLLAGIAQMRLREAGYTSDDLREYLGSYSSSAEVTPSELDGELQAIWESGTQRTNPEMNDEFRRKYAWAAIYRLRNRKNRRKLHFGFDEFVLLSSGITSQFIELCKYAFYFALEEGIPLKASPRVPDRLQTDAVYAVSERLLRAIDGNVPVVGASLQRLVNDLGTIMHARLLHHSSEPEANRVSIDDFAMEDGAHPSSLHEIVHGGVTWSVLHHLDAPDSYRPRSSGKSRSVELLINRIYCPALRISPRLRWRLELSWADLSGLVDPQKRETTLKRLVKKHGQGRGKSSDDDQGDLLGGIA